MKTRIGFIQGRLSPMIDGKIQAFPWHNWRTEFSLAKELNITLMEWTLDQDRIMENPFISTKGKIEIKKLMKSYGISIPSLTGDCFMQAPFYKALEEDRRRFLLECLDKIILSCGELGVTYIVIPLVDNGAIDNKEQELVLKKELLERAKMLKENSVKVVFESDLPPEKLAAFIKEFPEDSFGINYDSGNSASLSYDVNEEFKYYSNRILNLHIKDRLKGGTTVPLGTGNTNFDALFECIKSYSYKGNLILQTARATDGNHAKTLEKYKNFVLDRFLND